MDEHEIPNYWPGNCFGCSRYNLQGLHLRFWLSEKGCFTRCNIPEHLCGIDGLVHGGIITMLLEEVAQWSIIAHLGRFGITREISVRYLRHVPTNSDIAVEAQIIKKDEKYVVLHSTVNNSDGVLLVEGDSSWLLVTPSVIAKIAAVDEIILQEFLSKYSKKGEREGGF